MHTTVLEDETDNNSLEVMMILKQGDSCPRKTFPNSSCAGHRKIQKILEDKKSKFTQGKFSFIPMYAKSLSQIFGE